MLRGKALDTTIFDQARERPFNGSVPICSFGIAVDFLPCHKCLSRRKMNVTSIANLPVYVAAPIVANQTQRLSPAPHQSQATRKVQIVIQVLPLVDLVDRPVFRHGVEIPLPVSARLLQPTGTWIPHLLGRRAQLRERIVRQKQVSHRTLACDRFHRISGQRTGLPGASRCSIATMLLRLSVESHISFLGRTPFSRSRPIFTLLLQPTTPLVSPAFFKRNLPFGTISCNNGSSRLTAPDLGLWSSAPLPNLRREHRARPTLSGPCNAASSAGLRLSSFWPCLRRVLPAP